jgi:hypothetical protein
MSATDGSKCENKGGVGKSVTKSGNSKAVINAKNV